MKLIGAHIDFDGTVWTDRPRLQVLAPVLPLFYHSTDTIMRERAARYFGASKRAILALKDYYTDIEDLANQLNPAFPYQHSIPLSTDQKFSSNICFLVNEDRLTFCGKANDRTICIKIVGIPTKRTSNVPGCAGSAWIRRDCWRIAHGRYGLRGRRIWTLT
jgi:hypothetical protein